VAALVAADPGAAAVARAESPDPPPDPTGETAGGDAADEATFWADIALPGRARAGGLVERAARVLDRSASEAALLLEEAIALDGGRPRAFYLLGVARYRERAWPACAAALRETRRLDPDFLPDDDDAGARVGVDDMLGLCLALAGRFDDAIAHYQRMLAAPSTRAALDGLHLNLADCYLAQGRLDEAIAQLQAGLSLAPRRGLLWFGLAVAYDRDERVSRAREAMLRALELDPQLRELESPNTFFMPPEDAAYYHGLAHQAAAVADPPRRAAAIAHFRRFVALAPPGPWSERAARHLAELGSSSLALRDVAVHPHEPADAAAVAQKLAAALPDLQRCLEGHPHLAVRLTLAFADSEGGDRRPRPEPGKLTLQPLGAGPENAGVNLCLERRAQDVVHATRRPTRIQVVVIAR
jgi:tetratricopeptide (TPR) repeat protein